MCSTACHSSSVCCCGSRGMLVSKLVSFDYVMEMLHYVERRPAAALKFIKHIKQFTVRLPALEINRACGQFDICMAGT